MEIKRDLYLNKLINRKHNGLIKVITGIRRCGKSYLLFNLFNSHLISSGVPEDHIIKIAFDMRKTAELRDPDRLCEYVESKMTDSGMYYILLDEVQMLREFESVLNEFLHYDNADIYVTGSNSKFLSSDIMTEFRGRGAGAAFDRTCGVAVRAGGTAGSLRAGEPDPAAGRGGGGRPGECRGGRHRHPDHGLGQLPVRAHPPHPAL